MITLLRAARNAQSPMHTSMVCQLLGHRSDDVAAESARALDRHMSGHVEPLVVAQIRGILEPPAEEAHIRRPRTLRRLLKHLLSRKGLREETLDEMVRQLLRLPAYLNAPIDSCQHACLSQCNPHLSKTACSDRCQSRCKEDVEMAGMLKQLARKHLSHANKDAVRKHVIRHMPTAHHTHHQLTYAYRDEVERQEASSERKKAASGHASERKNAASGHASEAKEAASRQAPPAAASEKAVGGAHPLSMPMVMGLLPVGRGASSREQQPGWWGWTSSRLLSEASPTCYSVTIMDAYQTGVLCVPLAAAATALSQTLVPSVAEAVGWALDGSVAAADLAAIVASQSDIGVLGALRLGSSSGWAPLMLDVSGTLSFSGSSTLSLQSTAGWVPLSVAPSLQLPALQGAFVLQSTGAFTVHVRHEGVVAADVVDGMLAFSDVQASLSVHVGSATDAGSAVLDARINGTVQVGGAGGFAAALSGALDMQDGTATMTISHGGGWSPVPQAPFFTPAFECVADLGVGAYRVSVECNVVYSDPIVILPNGMLELHDASAMIELRQPTPLNGVVTPPTAASADLSVAFDGQLQLGGVSFLGALPIINVSGLLSPTGVSIVLAWTEVEWVPLPTILPSLVVPRLTGNFTMLDGIITPHVTHEPILLYPVVPDLFDLTDLQISASIKRFDMSSPGTPAFAIFARAGVQIGGPSPIGFSAVLSGSFNTQLRTATLTIWHPGGWSPLPAPLSTIFFTPMFECTALIGATVSGVVRRLDLRCDVTYTSPIVLSAAIDPDLLAVHDASAIIQVTQAHATAPALWSVDFAGSLRLGGVGFIGELPPIKVRGLLVSQGMSVVTAWTEEEWVPLPTIMSSLAIPRLMGTITFVDGFVDAVVTHAPLAQLVLVPDLLTLSDVQVSADVDGGFSFATGTPVFRVGATAFAQVGGPTGFTASMSATFNTRLKTADMTITHTCDSALGTCWSPLPGALQSAFTMPSFTCNAQFGINNVHTALSCEASWSSAVRFLDGMVKIKGLPPDRVAFGPTLGVALTRQTSTSAADFYMYIEASLTFEFGAINLPLLTLSGLLRSNGPSTLDIQMGSAEGERGWQPLPTLLPRLTLPTLMGRIVFHPNGDLALWGAVRDPLSFSLTTSLIPTSDGQPFELLAMTDWRVEATVDLNINDASSYQLMASASGDVTLGGGLQFSVTAQLNLTGRVVILTLHHDPAVQTSWCPFASFSGFPGALTGLCAPKMDGYLRLGGSPFLDTWATLQLPNPIDLLTDPFTLSVRGPTDGSGDPSGGPVFGVALYQQTQGIKPLRFKVFVKGQICIDIGAEFCVHVEAAAIGEGFQLNHFTITGVYTGGDISPLEAVMPPGFEDLVVVKGSVAHPLTLVLNVSLVPASVGAVVSQFACPKARFRIVAFLEVCALDDSPGASDRGPNHAFPKPTCTQPTDAPATHPCCSSHCQTCSRTSRAYLDR